MQHPAFLNDYDKAGAANTLFAPWTFVDDHLFVTKTRELGAVLRLEGVDYECLDPAERAAIVRRWAIALRLWDEHHRIYQFLFKTRHPAIYAERPTHPIARQAVDERLAWFAKQRDQLYALELYTVVLYEGWAAAWPRSTTDLARDPVGTLRTWMLTRDAVTLVDHELTRALGVFRNRLDAWQLQLAETVRPTLLAAPDAYHVLWRLVNYGH